MHSHLDHLLALLELARRQGMEERTWIHAFTDGRDVSPHAGATELARCRRSGSPRLSAATTRWTATTAAERTERACAAILSGEGTEATDPVAAVRASYEAGVTDEFVEPVVLAGRPRLAPGARRGDLLQLPPRPRPPALPPPAAGGVDLTTMTRYAEDIDVPVAFPEQDVHETLAEVLSGAGLRQLHAAETEKYAHVTYFFNGGEEREWEGEMRVLVPSPRDVPSYDLKPEMSAAGVADEVVRGFPAVSRSASSTSRTPTWSATPASSLPSSRPSKLPTPRSGGSWRRRALSAASASSPPTTATPRSCSSRTASARTRPTRRTRCRSSSPPQALVCAKRASSRDLAPTVLDLLGIPIPRAMTGTALSWDDGDG